VLIILGGVRARASVWSDRTGRFQQVVFLTIACLSVTTRVEPGIYGYFFRRNRDLGTISVYVGSRDVRCLPPLYVHIW